MSSSGGGPPSKAQRIDLWRHEVALAAASSSPSAAAAAAAAAVGVSEGTHSAPQYQQDQKRQRPRSTPSSFLAKLLRPKSRDAEEGFESTAMYGGTAAGSKAGAGSEARAPRGLGDGKDRDQDGEGGQSVARAGLSGSSSGAGGVLVATQERLERAARLLGKGGGREGKG